MINSMKRRHFLGAVGGAAALGAMSPRMALAQGVNIDMGTMGVGSAWYQYGISLSQYMGAALPAGSVVTVRDFAGGDGNLRLIESNQRVQLGMTFAMNLAWARNRMTDITDATADNVRLIAGGLDQYYVGTIALASIGVRSMSEILDAGRGLRVSTSQAGSTSDIGATQILAAHGLSIEENNARGGSYARVSLQAASENMVTGRSDVWVQMIVAGHPRVSELAFSHDIRLLGMSDEAMANMQERGFGRAEMPAGTFNGMDEPVVMPGTSTILIANAEMDEDVAYRMTRAIIENIDQLKEDNAGFALFTLERAADTEAAGGAPLHPGAERAYREAGVI